MTSAASAPLTAPDPYWRSPALGTAREVDLANGRLRFHDAGSGPLVVLSHGWLANANLWRKVVPLLASRFRCVTPDLPLGSHSLPMPADADLTPAGIASLLNGLVDALGVPEVCFVGNDSGGAYSQIAVAASPARVRHLVLNACETPYDAWPPPAFDGLQAAAMSGLAALAAMLEPLRDPALRQTPAAFGLLIKHPVDDAVFDTYALPVLENEGVRRDASRAFASASRADIEPAGRHLIESYEGSVGFVWPAEDVFFSLENVRRYAGELRRASVQIVEDSYAFSPEDQPEALARAIEERIAS